MARPHTLGLVQAINELLESPIAVLPQSESDIIRPFRIGIYSQIREQLKSEACLKALNGALRSYTHSQGYVIACAQPDAMRHDLDGNPVEPVSEADRLSATTRILLRVERRKKREAKSAMEEEVTQTAS